MIFNGDGFLSFLEKSLFLVFEEMIIPDVIHGLRKELEIFGLTSTSGKATSTASLII